jgi:nucleoside-diphosphate-sugar epimerase
LVKLRYALGFVRVRAVAPLRDRRCVIGGRLRILLTGVSGFVGGALGRHLRAAGHHVVGISRTPPRAGATDAFRAWDVSEALPDDLGDFDAIVHAAALASPWANPSTYVRINVRGTANVLDLARRSGAGHFVFISSSSVHYADGDQFGITETTPLPAQPTNAYAASKRAAEALVREAGMPHAILRPRAVFGVGDTVLFPRVLRAARLRMLPRFVRPDGQRTIGDVISIDNLVHTIGRAVELRATGDYNLTDGKPVDLYDFLGDVLARLGLPAPKARLPVGAAMAFAGMLESASKHAFGWREPPLTRFGVAVFSQSKTFDIGKAVAAFGPPPVPTAVAVERFVSWLKENRP